MKKWIDNMFRFTFKFKTLLFDSQEWKLFGWAHWIAYFKITMHEQVHANGCVRGGRRAVLLIETYQCSSLVPAAQHTETCLDPMCTFTLQEWLEFCGLQTFWIVWNNFPNEMRVSHGITSDMDVFWITYSSPTVWMRGFASVGIHPAWCNTGKCINRTRMDVQNRQKSHR